MKILLPVKRVVDPYVAIRVKSDASGVDTTNLKMSINPFDEIAVEEGVRLLEQKIVQELIVVSVGVAPCQEVMRHALALGATRGIWVDCADELCPLTLAKVLQVIVEREQIDLVLMGKQSIDGDNNQTGQMLAGLLGWPQATFASKIEFADGMLCVTREVDVGLETIRVKLPAVVTTDLRLNTPRYATLPNIMRAKQKSIDTLVASELGVTLNPHLNMLKVEPPPRREKGEIVSGVDELVEKLESVLESSG